MQTAKEHLDFVNEMVQDVREADKVKWVMDDEMKKVVRDGTKYLGHAAEEAKAAEAHELSLILDSMRTMLYDFTDGRDPSKALNDIAVSVKILKKNGILK